MSLSDIQQRRLLYWAQRLRESASGGRPIDAREVEAVGKLIDACDPILNPPVALAPGVHDKNGNTR